MDFEDNQDNDSEFEFTNVDVPNGNINYSCSCSSDSETSDLLQTKKKRVQVLQDSSDSETDTVPEPDSDSDNISESSWIDVSEEEDELAGGINFSVGDKNVGLQFQDKDFQPIDFFKRFFTDELIADIVKQTNIYARQKINSKVLKSRSMWNNWKEVTDVEMCAYGSTYCFLRKSVKWWRKLFFWGLETSAINSYILYKVSCNKNGVKPITHLRFIRKLVLFLVGDFRQGAKKRGRPSTSDLENRLDGKLHILVPHPERKHKDCMVCSNRTLKGERKTTVYFCETCNRHPSLHVGNCFKKYHTVKDYKN